MSKKNRTRRIRDGKEWERTGKPLKSLGGCNCRKGNNLAFCPLSNSQCGGQGFDPSLRSCPVEQNVTVDITRLNFRQDLTSFLHFRQCKLPKLGNRRKSQARNLKVFVDSRQGIASRRGKETLQVTAVVVTQPIRLPQRKAYGSK